MPRLLYALLFLLRFGYFCCVLKWPTTPVLSLRSVWVNLECLFSVVVIISTLLLTMFFREKCALFNLLDTVLLQPVIRARERLSRQKSTWILIFTLQNKMIGLNFSILMLYNVRGHDRQYEPNFRFILNWCKFAAVVQQSSDAGIRKIKMDPSLLYVYNFDNECPELNINEAIYLVQLRKWFSYSTSANLEREEIPLHTSAPINPVSMSNITLLGSKIML